METELKRILANLTPSQRPMVERWYQDSLKYHEITDGLVVGTYETEHFIYKCERKLKLVRKSVRYNYTITKNGKFYYRDLISAKYDPQEYIKHILSIQERAKGYGKRESEIRDN